MVIAYVGEDDEWIKKFKAPKNKEVTIEWILGKINQDSSYTNLYWYLKKHFASINVYAASYGVGVSTLCNYKEVGDSVSKKLTDLGLKFRTEFSEAGWVYRFIVGKDKDNIRILQAL